MSFTLKVNLTGAGERRGPGGSGEPTVSGAYKVTLAEPKLHTKKDATEANSVEFLATISEGDFAGYVAKIYIGLDTSKDGNRKAWRTALLSAGYGVEEIDGGEIDISPALFADRSAWIFFQARDPNDRASSSEKYFITAEGAQKIIEHGVPAAAQYARGSNNGGVEVQSTVAVQTASVAAATPVAAAAGVTKPKLGGLRSMIKS
jgi:hypothetical protein